MFYSKPTKLTSKAEAIRLIEEARNAELCRDLRLSQRILSRIWPNLEDEPQVEGLEPVLEAEILRLCGFFASYYGRSRNLKNFQERGRDFLTRAIGIFEAENLQHKSAEARVMLSLCYWHEGAVRESETILAETEAEYANNQLHPVYIQICINRVITLLHSSDKNPANIQKGMEIIKKLAVPIEFCEDLRLKSMYHNHAGIYFYHFKDPAQALHHHQEGIKTALQAGNYPFVAINYNNIAYLYRELKDYENAHLNVDKAIKFFDEMAEPGWLAHALDTKALIYFDEGKCATALEAIERALELFRQGEDYAGLCDALFNKSKILLRLNRLPEALMLLAEIAPLATMRISESAAQNYAAEFAALLYPIKDKSYPEEVRDFKSHLLSSHLKKADLQVTKAAESLGISHQNLSDILNNQYPELYETLGIRRRAARGSRSAGSANKKKKSERATAGDFYRRITPVKLQQSEMSFADGIKIKSQSLYLTFVMEGKHLPDCDVDRDVIVLIEATEKTRGACVILQERETGEFHCGILEMDEFTEIFYFRDFIGKDDFPVLLDEYKYCGKIIAFCPLEQAAEGKVVFRPYR